MLDDLFAMPTPVTMGMHPQQFFYFPGYWPEKPPVPDPDQIVALDCEFIGVKSPASTEFSNALASISLVDGNGNVLYESRVKKPVCVQEIDYRTHVTGFKPGDLDIGPTFQQVQESVRKILYGKILIGHDLENDLSVLNIYHPKQYIRDTSEFFMCYGKKLRLKLLAKTYLNRLIQEDAHDPRDDALAALDLYLLFQDDWELSLQQMNFEYVQQNYSYYIY